MADKKYWLKLTLQSDAAFGRGDGLAGVVNAEVKHDIYGLPYLGGKTLKGLLVAECAEILFALKQIDPGRVQAWENAAQFLFGAAGSSSEDQAMLRVGDACLPEDFQRAVVQDYRLLNEFEPEKRERKWGLKQAAYLSAFTSIRQQTAINPQTGAPLRNSLRSVRVILRKTPFAAQMNFEMPSSQEDEKFVTGLLAACVKGLRRAGNSRNRGLGKLCASIADEQGKDVTSTWYGRFKEEVQR